MTQAATYPEWMEERLDRDDRVLELAPDEAVAFSLFATLETQWDRHAMTGTRIGLNYSRIPKIAQMMSIPMTPALLTDMRVMESAALAEFAQKASR